MLQSQVTESVTFFDNRHKITHSPFLATIFNCIEGSAVQKGNGDIHQDK